MLLGPRFLLLVATLATPASISTAATPAAASVAAHHAKDRSLNVALGVPCAHCHNPSASRLPPKPTYLFARRMIRMVDGLNAGVLNDLGGVTCWTCHRGKTKPARLPAATWEALQTEYADVFVGPRVERAVSMSVYAASLGQRCDHCHIEKLWGDDSKYQKGLTFKMLSLFKEIPKYFEPARMPNLQCFLCHQGQVKPERAPAP